MCMCECGIESVCLMKRTALDDNTLSVRARVVLFYNTNVGAARAVSYADDELSYDLFLSAGVRPINILVAGLTPNQLKARGFDCASKMKTIGFDALHLTNAAFCNTMNLAYGRNNILEHFLVSAQDAVSLAGSQATSILNVSTRELLEKCIGEPAHALDVLKQMPQATALKGVQAELLLDCGLRLVSLAKLGYTVESIVRNTDASPVQLQKLGFTLS